MLHQDPAQAGANASTLRLRRNAAILRFLFRYRSAGVFTGLDLSTLPGEATAEVGGGEEVAGSPERFVEDLEALGPTFVKLGQMLSTRPDLVPPAYAAALERMQDDVSPVPVEEVRAVIESELGVRINKAFAEFDETPLGCASLAQVHRVTLRDGRAVAIKVQRPDIVPVLLGDLDLLAGLATTADRLTDIGRRVRFADWLHEFRKTLLAELDYQSEADNLERFGHHLAPFPLLWVPQPLRDFCSHRVLTMELATGVKVNHVSGPRRTEQDMAPLALALTRAYLDQVFVHGEIHADPHPGNLLVTEDGRLAIFDLGMVAHVPPRRRDRMLKLLFAAVDGRGERVAEESIGLGTRLEDYDEERYQREVGQLVARYAAHSGSASAGRMMLELVRVATACGLRTPPEMGLLGKTLLNLEAVSQCLAPGLDLKHTVEGHLQHVMFAKLRKSFSPPHLASELLEVQTLAMDAPRKLSQLLALLADNRVQVRVTGLEESHLMENLQKIANRISAGVIVAALILASALMMQVPTDARLLGYPTVALVLFALGVALGLGIVLSAWSRDRSVPAREERTPR